MTTAFVLSGGGNRGPIQIGALRSLLEHGIRPDFLVGTSAGSLNAGFLAAYGPDLTSVARLASAWHCAEKGAAYPGNLFTIAWRVFRGADSLFPSDRARALIAENLPPGVTTFGQLKCPCYVTAVDLRSSRLYLFGDDPAAPLLDALMASSAVPGVHPPLDYHGLQLVDGGLLATTPAGIAMEHGADVIYAINLGPSGEVQPPVRGIPAIMARVLNTYTVQSLLADLDRATADPAISLHHIYIAAFEGLPFNDFRHIDEMIAAGQAATDAYLADPQPRMVARPAALLAPEPAIAGARPYVPLHWRAQ